MIAKLKFTIIILAMVLHMIVCLEQSELFLWDGVLNEEQLRRKKEGGHLSREEIRDPWRGFHNTMVKIIRSPLTLVNAIFGKKQPKYEDVEEPYRRQIEKFDEEPPKEAPKDSKDSDDGYWYKEKINFEKKFQNTFFQEL